MNGKMGEKEDIQIQKRKYEYELCKVHKHIIFSSHISVVSNIVYHFVLRVLL